MVEIPQTPSYFASPSFGNPHQIVKSFKFRVRLSYVLNCQTYLIFSRQKHEYPCLHINKPTLQCPKFTDVITWNANKSGLKPYNNSFKPSRTICLDNFIIREKRLHEMQTTKSFASNTYTYRTHFPRSFSL